MKINQIYEILNQQFPFDDAMEWDNCGILLNQNKDIKKVLLALDLNTEVLNQALEHQVDLIITHHPFIFDAFEAEMKIPWKSKIWTTMNDQKISLIAIHTNSDVSKVGLNASLLKALNIKKWSFFNEDHLGLIAKFDEKIKIKDLILQLKKAWYLDNVRFSGNLNQTCKTIAIIGGSGGEYYQDAYDSKADLFISSEIKWHHFIGAKEIGINVIEVCHSVETFFISSIRDLLMKHQISVIEVRNILNVQSF